MTQTLTTERLDEIAKLAVRLFQISGCAAVTSSGETVMHHTFVDEILSALHDVTAELLANQEAQQRIAELSAAVIELTTQRDLWYEKTRDLEAVLGRRPAPAATTPISFSENADADMCREWAWKQVKEQLTPDGWTVGDNITYFGFFCWGWDMRRQYNEQRPPAPVVNPEFTGATAVPDFKALAENLVENLVDCGGADEKAVEQFLKWTEKTCRAAMLAQPVNQGYRLNSPVIPDGC